MKIFKRITGASVASLLIATAVVGANTSMAQADGVTGQIFAPVNTNWEDSNAGQAYGYDSIQQVSQFSTANTPALEAPDVDNQEFDRGAYVGMRTLYRGQNELVVADHYAEEGYSLMPDADSVSALVYLPAAVSSMTLTLTGTVDGTANGTPTSISSTLNGLEPGFWQQLNFDFSENPNFSAAANYNAFSFTVPGWEPATFPFDQATIYIDNIKFNYSRATVARTEPSRLVPFENEDTGTVGTDPQGLSIVSDAPSKGNNYGVKSMKVTQYGYCDDRILLYTAPRGESLISANHKTVTANFYSETIGDNVTLYLEDAPNTVRIVSVQTTKVGWQTMSFDFSARFNPDVIYSKLSINPDYGQNNCSKGLFYIDDIAFNGATTPSLTGGGNPVDPPVTPPTGGSGATGSADLPIGDTLAAATIDVVLTGLQAGSPVQVFAKSKPVLIASGVAGANGEFRKTVKLPSSLMPGDHSVIARVKDATGKSKSISVVKFSVTRKMTIGSRSPIELATASPRKGKVYVAVRNAAGKTVKITVSGKAKTITRLVPNNHYTLRISTRAGMHDVAVMVGSRMLTKMVTVK